MDASRETDLRGGSRPERFVRPASGAEQGNAALNRTDQSNNGVAVNSLATGKRIQVGEKDFGSKRGAREATYEAIRKESSWKGAKGASFGLLRSERVMRPAGTTNGIVFSPAILTRENRQQSKPLGCHRIEVAGVGKDQSRGSLSSPPSLSSAVS